MQKGTHTEWDRTGRARLRPWNACGYIPLTFLFANSPPLETELFHAETSQGRLQIYIDTHGSDDCFLLRVCLCACVCVCVRACVLVFAHLYSVNLISRRTRGRHMWQLDILFAELPRLLVCRAPLTVTPSPQNGCFVFFIACIRSCKHLLVRQIDLSLVGDALFAFVIMIVIVIVADAAPPTGSCSTTSRTAWHTS